MSDISIIYITADDMGAMSDYMIRLLVVIYVLIPARALLSLVYVCV
jgi:hypothetical protein